MPLVVVTSKCWLRTARNLVTNAGASVAQRLCRLEQLASLHLILRIAHSVIAYVTPCLTFWLPPPGLASTPLLRGVLLRSCYFCRSLATTPPLLAGGGGNATILFVISVLVTQCVAISARLSRHKLQ